MASSENVGSTCSASEQSQSLKSLFEEGLNLFNNLGKIDEPTNSPAVQLNVKKAIRICEDATRLVSIAGIFSTNEAIDEVATEDLRYILLPALLGSLCLKLTSRDRKDVIEVAEVYYKDFLQRCNDYGLSNYKFNKEESDNHDSVETKRTEFDEIRLSINTRAGKIQRFKEQKELKMKLEEISSNMENENVDEEIKRKYFLTMIQLFIYEGVDELGSIEAEKEILVHMSSIHAEEKPKPRRPPPPLKPVIITKDAVQKAVFGAGYPSLPVMSVEEFYEKRVQEGIFPSHSHSHAQPLKGPVHNANTNTEEEELERKVEQDDPELLAKLRQKDDFKDDHRRGWGNRANRS